MNGSSHPKHEKNPENNIIARILALLMGAARPTSVAKSLAAEAIVPNMACMQDTQTGEPAGYSHLEHLQWIVLGCDGATGARSLPAIAFVEQVENGHLKMDD